MITFFLLFEFAAFGGLFGLFLAFLILPACTRYLMLLLEARSGGDDPGPPGIELFNLFDSAWSLFPVVHLLVLVYATHIVGSVFGPLGLFVVDGLLVLLIPASLAVLAITRSPVESVRPGALLGLINRCGLDYLVAPVFLMSATILTWWLGTLPVIEFLVELLGFYLLFASFALIGGLMRPFELHREVDIPAPVEADPAAVDEKLSMLRVNVLNHAYGFISRGNREGGIRHIRAWLDDDPDPCGGWAWFVDQMLDWEEREQVLPFAQEYVGHLLHGGDQVAAVKLMLRCRLVHESFRPLPEDLELAREAAEKCQNEELTSFLR